MSGRGTGPSIVAATGAHAPAIARIEVTLEGGDADVLVPRIEGELEKIATGVLPRYTCVALVDGEVVAFARCRLRDADPEFPEMPAGWYLFGINVAAAWRRRGIGRALTAHRLAWLGPRTEVVYYATAMGNEGSVALHAEFGFVERAADVWTPAYAGRTRGRVFERRG